MVFLLLVLGMVLLMKGADLFVDGSASVARKLKVPSVIIGLTIVALGTSLPEASVSITAGLMGSNEIAISNIVDSNILEAIDSRGLYLFSGPVGSGKTTLMYQLVREKFPDKQVITIEDPVEIKQDNMLQLQLNDEIGMTYDNLIKLSLRHRPDILIIGEIRDSETARVVIRASLTGVLVFSTIHAKSIPGVYARLLELGVSRQELENSLRAIIYQRLIGGGGVVDFAKGDFEYYPPTRWNEQIKSLARDGHISLEEAKIEKIAL